MVASGTTERGALQGMLMALPAAMMLILAGCGGEMKPTASVEGTVTHDGKPVTGGSVIFAPVAGESGSQKPGRPITLKVGEDGTYSGRAVIGQNRIRYTPPSAGEEEENGGEGEGQDGHAEEQDEPSPYEGLAPQPGTVEITGGSNVVDVKLVATSEGSDS